MTTAERFEDLEVWQRARALTNLIYNQSDSGSFARDYGLRDQIRRAAVSIMSNCSKQLSRLIHYLETQPNSRRERENEEYYVVEY